MRAGKCLGPILAYPCSKATSTLSRAASFYIYSRSVIPASSPRFIPYVTCPLPMLFLSHFDHPFATDPRPPASPQSLSPKLHTRRSLAEDRPFSRASLKILDIPVEILVEVLKCVECKYLLRCMLVRPSFPPSSHSSSL